MVKLGCRRTSTRTASETALTGQRSCLQARLFHTLLGAAPTVLAAVWAVSPGEASAATSPIAERRDDKINRAAVEILPAGALAVISPATAGAALTADMMLLAQMANRPDAVIQPLEALATNPSQPRPLGNMGPQAVAQNNGGTALIAFDRNAANDPDLHPDELLALFPDGAGQSRESLDELDLVLGPRQIFSDLRSLQDRITDTQHPTINATFRRSSQSDHVDITQGELSSDLFFRQGRDQLRLAVQALNYNPSSGQGLSEFSGGGTGNFKLNDITAVAGEFWLNHVKSGPVNGFIVTYDAFLTLRPVDSIRLDLDTSRRTFDNIRSLQLGITAQSVGGSVDFTPAADLRLTVRAAGSFFNDGNERRSEEVEAIWRAKSNPVIEIGLRGTNFAFSKLLNNGYFNPNDYQSGELMFRLQSSLSKKFTVELAGSGGVENSNPGGTKPLVKASLQAAYKLSGHWSLDAELSQFSSRSSNSSGFSRTSIQVGLHRRLGRSTQD